jgi:hypothetical protein
VEMLLIVGGLVVVGLLALAAGYDSRDGPGGDEAARWDDWRWAAAARRRRFGDAVVGHPLELDLLVRPADALVHAAAFRLVAGRPNARRVLAPAAYRLGELLMTGGRRLQELAAPREAALGGPI